MSKIYADDSLTLHTDLYQINMAESYWADGVHNDEKPYSNCFSASYRLAMAMLYLQGLNACWIT